MSTPPPAHIPLAPEEWYWATWRNLPPLPRPAVRPFDRAACLAALASEESSSTFNWRIAQDTTTFCSPEEACFWVEVIRQRHLRQQSAQDIAAILVDFEPDIAAAKAWVRETFVAIEMFASFTHVLAGLFSPIELVQLVTDDEQLYFSTNVYLRSRSAQFGFYRTRFMQTFRSLVLPYLSAEERAALCEHMRPAIDLKKWPTHDMTSFYLAASLGMQDIIQEIIHITEKSDRKDAIISWYSFEEIILGLNSAEQVQTQMRCYKFTNWSYARAWIAHTEMSAIDWIAQHNWIKELVPFSNPEIAPHMLAFVQDDQHAHIARDWLYTHRENAVAGLLAMPRDHPQWPLAARWVSQVALAGVLGQHRSAHAAVASALLAEAETPAWLREAAQAVAQHPERHAAWVDATLLPPVAHQGRLLTHDQLDAILHALRASADGPPDPLLALVRGWLAEEERDRLLVYLGAAWHPSRLTKWTHSVTDSEQMRNERWVISALGLLGGAKSADSLGEITNTCRRLGFTPLARHALACLGMIGSDAAFQVLQRIIDDERIAAFHQHALVIQQQIADARGQSINAMRNRLMPAYGLDGSLSFGYPTERFWPVLTDSLEAALRASDGQITTELPDPSKLEDFSGISERKEQWQSYQHDMARLIRLNIDRFQDEMLAQNRWLVGDVRDGLLAHPLFRPLALRMLWARSSQGGYHALLFTEDGSLVDEEYHTVNLASDESITLAHPALATPDQWRRWIDMLEDFVIIPIFPQATRPVYTLDHVPHSDTQIDKLQGAIFGSKKYAGIMRSRGWFSHDMPDMHHVRFFSGLDTTAVLHSTIVSLHGTAYRTVQQLCFAAGHVAPADPYEPLPLAQVHPIVLSESLWDLAILDGQKR